MSMLFRSIPCSSYCVCQCTLSAARQIHFAKDRFLFFFLSFLKLCCQLQLWLMILNTRLFWCVLLLNRRESLKPPYSWARKCNHSLLATVPVMICGKCLSPFESFEYVWESVNNWLLNMDIMLTNIKHTTPDVRERTFILLLRMKRHIVLYNFFHTVKHTRQTHLKCKLQFSYIVSKLPIRC